MYSIYIPVTLNIELWVYPGFNKNAELVEFFKNKYEVISYKSILELDNYWALSKSLSELIKSINKLLPFI